MTGPERFIPKHGGYRRLKSFQLAQLIDRRCSTADDVAAWVKECGRHGQRGPGGRPTYPEIAANAALTLLAVACSLLDRQIAAQAADFENEGGFTERLYRVRTSRRATPTTPPTKFTRSSQSTKSTPSTKSTNPP